jgi:hypothetical protein
VTGDSAGGAAGCQTDRSGTMNALASFDTPRVIQVEVGVGGCGVEKIERLRQQAPPFGVLRSSRTVLAEASSRPPLCGCLCPRGDLNPHAR